MTYVHDEVSDQSVHTLGLVRIFFERSAQGAGAEANRSPHWMYVIRHGFSRSSPFSNNAFTGNILETDSIFYEDTRQV